MTDTNAREIRQYLNQLALNTATDATSDAELLARFAANRDEAAFTILVSRHGPLVQRVCRRVLTDSNAADDAFQATFLVLARKAGAIGRRDLLANWLYGVAYRVASRARADAARRRAREAQAALRQAADPLEEMSARELCAALDEELVRLPERFRLPLLLCCVEGRTRDEVARELKWSMRTLARRLEAGREMLRGRLGRRGVALPAAILAGSVVAPPASAKVPAAMIAATVDAGRASPSAVPSHVAALADTVLRANSTSRRVTTAVLLAALSVVGSATAVTYYRRDADKPDAVPPNRVEPAAESATDPLPTGASKRFGSTRLRHQHTIVSVSFSRLGRRLASGSWDDTARVWDFATGRELRVFTPDLPNESERHHAISSVALSPDGKLLAAGDMERTLTVWDFDSGKELFRMNNLENTVIAASFSPDGRYLAATSCGAIRIWDVRTWAEILKIGVPSGGVRQVNFSPDGSRLATLNENGTAQVIEVKSGEMFDQFGGAKLRAIFLPDGKTVATATANGKVSLRDTKLQKEARRIDVGKDGFGVIAISPDGQTLAYAKDSMTIHLIDLASGQILRTCKRAKNDDGIADLVFSPDGKRLVSCGHQLMLHIWDMATAKEIPPPAGHTAEVKRIAMSLDGRSIFSTGQDGRLILWDRASGEAAHVDQVANKASDSAINTDRRIAALAVKNEIRLWDLASHRLLHSLVGHQGEVNSVAISPDGKTVASASWRDHTIRLWNRGDGMEKIKINLPTPNGVNYGECPMVFSADGKMLISGSADRVNNTMYFWDASTGKELRSVKQQVSRLALSPDGRRLASAGWDKRIHLWDAASATEIRNWAAEGAALAFSPDGRLLATGGIAGTTHVWEVSTGVERIHFAGHRSGGVEHAVFAAGVSALAFSDDGRTLYSGGGDTTILSWDLFAAPSESAKLEALWADLGDDNGAKAHTAIGQFLSAGDAAVIFLKTRLTPVLPADPAQVTRLVSELDSLKFNVREHATKALEQMGESALPFLSDRHSDTFSTEGRKRLRAIRERIQSSDLTRPVKQQFRAMEILEHLGTAQARAVIEKLAAGVPQAHLTLDAKATMARLAAKKSSNSN